MTLSVKRLKKSKVRRKFANANTRLPTDVTPLIVQEISSWPNTVKNRYLKDLYLTKFVSADTDSPQLRRSRAIEKWLSCEKRNAETNERLYSIPSSELILRDISYGRFVEWTRAFIRRVIGDVPPIESLLGDFSGGASTSRSRLVSHPANKYVGKAHVTRDAFEWWKLVLDDMEGWSLINQSPYCVDDFNFVDGNHLFTVPKNAVIDRVACKEPDLNMFMQKGVGSFIRRRLLSRCGISLNDQSRNRDLAREGSISGTLATLDLSSASDSVTLSLVETLLPPVWFSLLDDLRSKKTLIDGIWHDCEMFSSMGNGFTFELESLLFFALCRATMYFGGHRGTVSVYGDDIICPTAGATDLIRILNLFGFSVNADKSFTAGPLRESCGGHYHDGHDVTPFFIREPISTLSDLIHFLNELRRWAERSEYGPFLDEQAWALWALLSEYVPRILRGGDRTSAGRSQLISYDEPVSRLVPVCRPIAISPKGKYILQLNKLRNRTSTPEAVTNSADSIVLSVCRVRPARRFGWHDVGRPFLNEWTRLHPRG